MTAPVRYSPTVEQPEADEAETIQGLKDQFKIILDTTSKDYGHAVRSVHAKGHGLARGTLTIAEGLPAELAQGIGAQPGTYDTVLRFSTNAGDILDDSIGLPRGCAIKIMGIEGERLPGAEGNTQDIVMANGKVFAAPNPKAFLGNLKMLAKTTDVAEGGKKVLSSVLRAAEAVVEAVGGQSALLSTLGGAKPVHPLGATYYSQGAFRYGDNIAKFSLKPTGEIATWAEETINASGRPDAIREAMNELLNEQGGTWELQVQLCTDLEKMPVEDASVEWDEEESPFRTIGTIKVEPQTAWTYGDSEKTEDALSFSPWHGITAHQPLGGINRARKDPYKFSADYRSEFNGCPIHEPAKLEELA